MKITIENIPKAQQRYDTWGDWYYDNVGDAFIWVSCDEPNLPTENHMFLIALHELVEMWLCRHRGISQEKVDAFDMANEKCEYEVGDLSGSPYRKEHRFAMLIEHLMAHELGMLGYGTVA